jgi:hypothetical protein
MTWKQIKALRNGLPPMYRRNELTKEEKQLHNELDCREMINSCLIYWTDFLNSRYKEMYIEDLWIRRVKQLYNEQKSDFEKAEIKYCVYEDSEWWTYNSIKRADD